VPAVTAPGSQTQGNQKWIISQTQQVICKQKKELFVSPQ
jgi:hypothetical protein